ncbi:putative membrane protein [Sediminihabitans luteus]|uniref:Putative membrane protein n=1 Tax=Sediminihabitans luteus TaxID=1138585 RepID=A0A2M9CC27_9CELL|nr:DUF1304 domain-containing protein [Sediminihabitans luteus]PJJ68605.1 putative membrane protein [Sediminihabitans luteus]GII99943.1 membrane protein [Sediminihabitans luteus]
MFDHLSVAATVLVVLAGLLHVAIFTLESVLWRRPDVHRRFGVGTPDEAEVLRPMAFNQGFYNLFLALGALVGVLLATSDDAAAAGAGVGMALLAVGSMLAAALVLVLSNPRLARAALTQGLLPLGAVVLIVVG